MPPALTLLVVPDRVSAGVQPKYEIGITLSAGSPKHCAPEPPEVAPHLKLALSNAAVTVHPGCTPVESFTVSSLMAPFAVWFSPLRVTGFKVTNGEFSLIVMPMLVLPDTTSLMTCCGSQEVGAVNVELSRIVQCSESVETVKAASAVRVSAPAPVWVTTIGLLPAAAVLSTVIEQLTVPVALTEPQVLVGVPVSVVKATETEPPCGSKPVPLTAIALPTLPRLGLAVAVGAPGTVIVPVLAVIQLVPVGAVPHWPDVSLPLKMPWKGSTSQMAIVYVPGDSAGTVTEPVSVGPYSVVPS